MATHVPTELEELIKSIDIHKNSSIENVITLLFKDYLLASLDKVTHLFYLILGSGLFPDSWKQATIEPLFQSSNKHMVGNYRPISLLPAIVKLFQFICI